MRRLHASIVVDEPPPGTHPWGIVGYAYALVGLAVVRGIVLHISAGLRVMASWFDCMLEDNRRAQLPLLPPLLAGN